MKQNQFSHHVLCQNHTAYCELSEFGWYWGRINHKEAEEVMAGQPDNVFMVRDSFALTHILCCSVRQQGRVLHFRLEHKKGLFSMNNKIYVPPSLLAAHCVSVCEEMFPKSLAKPLNRFARLDSLQMICRLAIRRVVPKNTWGGLPLPGSLICYVSNGSDYIAS